MELQYLELKNTGAFSPIFLDYLYGNPLLKPFYHRPPEKASFEAQILEKQQNFPLERRKILQTALETQYNGKATALQKQAIQDLSLPNTFVITTGHQLSLFTGPLYFIYKIITAIKLAAELQETFPDYKFYPVYWMHTEDHDFEEINHFHLFGEKYQWQTEQKGPVGWFETAELVELFKQLPEKISLFEEAYLQNVTLKDATFQLVNAIFQEYPLLCLDASAPNLKKQFAPLIWEDIQQKNAYKEVLAQSEKLMALGCKIQLTPREINFFYLEKGTRARFIEENNRYTVQDSSLTFTEESLKNLLENHPEKFSPNVVMRPLYQEYILPNLAYVGGPGEIAYWLQLKGVFDYYKVTFPVLMPRNFALIINKTNYKKLQKLATPLEELFWEESALKNSFLHRHAEEEISLEKYTVALTELFEQVAQTAKNTDISLEKWVKAEGQKAQKILENIEKRLKKQAEQNLQTEIRQLITLKNKLFPNNTLQERQENLLSFYLNQPDFIQELQEKFTPFLQKMYVFFEKVS